MLIQFQFLGPKDRQLIAPSVRAGTHLSIAQRPEGPAQSWRTFGAQATNRRIYPALTDGATNFRSFGPKACGRLKVNPHQTVGQPATNLPHRAPCLIDPGLPRTFQNLHPYRRGNEPASQKNFPAQLTFHISLAANYRASLLSPASLAET